MHTAKRGRLSASVPLIPSPCPESAGWLTSKEAGKQLRTSCSILSQRPPPPFKQSLQGDRILFAKSAGLISRPLLQMSRLRRHLLSLKGQCRVPSRAWQPSSHPSKHQHQIPCKWCLSQLRRHPRNAGEGRGLGVSAEGLP